MKKMYRSLLIIIAIIFIVVSSGGVKSEAVESRAVTEVTVGKVTGFEAITITKTSITLSWNEVYGASGYQIFKNDGSGNKTITNNCDKTMLVVSNLNVGKSYKFYIRAFRLVNGKKVYGNWSSISAKTADKKSGSTSINAIGTFHDNSWDGVTLQEIGMSSSESVKKNLLHYYKVVNGKVKDVVTGKTVEGLKVCADDPTYFIGDNKTRIAFDSQYNNGTYNLKFERASVDPYQSHWLSFNSNYLRADGLYVYENMPKKDIFVAVATDYTNKKSYARINGTAANIKMINKSDVYKYYRYAIKEIVVTSNHKIKELKVYSGVRSANQIRADYKKVELQIV